MERGESLINVRSKGEASLQVFAGTAIPPLSRSPLSFLLLLFKLPQAHTKEGPEDVRSDGIQQPREQMTVSRSSPRNGKYERQNF